MRKAREEAVLAKAAGFEWVNVSILIFEKWMALVGPRESVGGYPFRRSRCTFSRRLEPRKSRRLGCGHMPTTKGRTDGFCSAAVFYCRLVEIRRG